MTAAHRTIRVEQRLNVVDEIYRVGTASSRDSCTTVGREIFMPAGLEKNANQQYKHQDSYWVFAHILLMQFNQKGLAYNETDDKLLFGHSNFLGRLPKDINRVDPRILLECG